jgi:hypothetical protein
MFTRLVPLMSRAQSAARKTRIEAVLMTRVLTASSWPQFSILIDLARSRETDHGQVERPPVPRQANEWQADVERTRLALFGTGTQCSTNNDMMSCRAPGIGEDVNEDSHSK